MEFGEQLLVAHLRRALAQQPVVTGHYDNARTGANIRETILTPRNVNPQSFGRLGKLPVTGCVVAQPLYVPGVEIPSAGKRNVLYIATTANLVYGVDADSFALYFTRNLGTPASSTEMNAENGYFDFPNCDGIDRPALDVEPPRWMLPTATFTSFWILGEVPDRTASLRRRQIRCAVGFRAAVSDEKACAGRSEHRAPWR